MNNKDKRIIVDDTVKVVVKLLKKDGIATPTYETHGSAGMDIRANISQPITINSLERALIPTGLVMEIPEGYEIQVRARSGLALNYGMTVANGVGTIDSDYRGEIKVILANLGKDPFTVNPQDRIAQIVLNKVEKIEFDIVGEVDKTKRGDGGFGHTGV